MPLISKRIYERLLEKKKRLDALRPLPPSLLARLRGELTIEYTYDTNAIEGGTLTLRETRLVLEEGLTTGGRPLKDYLEARNHPHAIKHIEEIAAAVGEIDEDAVLRTHELVLLGVDETAGRYRTSTVRITGATFMPPPSAEVRQRILDLLAWLRDNPDELTPIELAALFHHRLVQIHPFNEGNGRTARLLMNAILIRNGYPYITNITHHDRARYLRTLSEADQGNTSPLVNFIARSVERALDAYINAIEEPEILSLAEAAQHTTYSQEYLSLLARRGSIGAFKRGRNWYITRRDLERYIKSIKAKRRKNR